MQKSSIWKIAGLSVLLSLGAPVFTHAQIPPTDVSELAEKPVQDRSYAFGAMMAKGLQQSNLSAEEKDLDAFVKGCKAGMNCDEASLKKANEVLRTRLQSGTVTTGEAAKDVAYQLGVNALGQLAVYVDIPESDFDMDALREGFQTVSDGKTPRMTEEQLNQILQGYFTPLHARKTSKRGSR